MSGGQSARPRWVAADQLNADQPHFSWHGLSKHGSMPRKVVPESDIHFYHVTARCLNREWFCIPLNDVWSIMEDYLFFLRIAYEVEVHSFVLMPNHFHLLLKTPLNNLSAAMNYFMRETSKRIGEMANRINHIYGGRFHRTLIDDDRYFRIVYKYVYRNPVKAGIVRRVEDYPYATLQGKLGRGKLIISGKGDDNLFSYRSHEEYLKWLNRAPIVTDEKAVQLALRKSKFKFPLIRTSRTLPTIDPLLF